MRDMVRENHVRIDELIYPIFVTEGEDIKHPVESMPGIYQYSLDRLPEEINRIKETGIKAILIFGIPDHKDEVGSVHTLKMELYQKQSVRLRKNTKN